MPNRLPRPSGRLGVRSPLKNGSISRPPAPGRVPASSSSPRFVEKSHSLSLSALDEVAEHYWSGRTVEEIGLTFMNEPWREPPVIEALYQGSLEAASGQPQSGWLPGFR